MKANESTSSFHSEKGFESFTMTPDNKGISSKTGTESDADKKEIKSEVEEMADIKIMTMGDYKKRIREDNGPGLVPPEIPAERSFELNGNILSMLKDIPFARKEYEDAFKHIDRVKDIANYFNVLDVPRESVLLRMLLVTFTSEAKVWLKSLMPGSITTWENLHYAFIEQFSPPLKISKLKKKIANFQQEVGESLYEAWERYKGLLRNCPQQDLNVQQEVSIFYNGVNTTTRQLLDSQGTMTKKEPIIINELLEEFAKHSCEYHNPR